MKPHRHIIFLPSVLFVSNCHSGNTCMKNFTDIFEKCRNIEMTAEAVSLLQAVKYRNILKVFKWCFVYRELWRKGLILTRDRCGRFDRQKRYLRQMPPKPCFFQCLRERKLHRFVRSMLVRYESLFRGQVHFWQLQVQFGSERHPWEIFAV